MQQAVNLSVSAYVHVKRLPADMQDAASSSWYLVALLPITRITGETLYCCSHNAASA